MSKRNEPRHAAADREISGLPLHRPGSRSRLLLSATMIWGAATSLPAQEPERAPQGSLLERVQRLERENREMRARQEALEGEVERVQLGDVVGPLGDSRHGLGAAASKVYGVESGLSIGGYGEFLFQQRSGDTDRFDALRAVTYIGFKLDENFVVNTEIELEHGTTSSSSGTTGGGGSASLEFGYVDYLHSDVFNLRGGLVLVPQGMINELHEPTAFLAANRSQTETRIIPTTWRELGAGVFGEVAGFSYRGYVLQGLNGENFDATGLRGGRQKGNRAAADDLAGVLRIDWTDAPGLLLGGSAYYGKAGQDNVAGGNRIPALQTVILEAHGELELGAAVFRALYATALVSDAATFNTNTMENLGDRLEGYYVEGGYDLMAHINPESGQSLMPYVRYERIDTQAGVPVGFTRDRTQRDDIWTFGVNYKPIDQVVVKLDFDARDEADDQLNLLLGYVF